MALDCSIFLSNTHFLKIILVINCVISQSYLSTTLFILFSINRFRRLYARYKREIAWTIFVSVLLILLLDFFLHIFGYFKKKFTVVVVHF